MLRIREDSISRDIPTSYLIGAPTTFYGALKKHNGFLRTWTVIYRNTAGILQEYCRNTAGIL
jgi:hypothetical protein